MCFVEVRINMRMLIVSGVVLIFLSSVSGGSGGINEEMSLEGTGLISMNYNDFVLSSESFEIELELDSETSDNGTQVTWVTQICINTGVCYPPENNRDWVTNDESKLVGSVNVDDDASYINWRIKMNWSDGDEENFPENGFGWKVWSNCWFDGEEWGGIDESCNSEGNESKIAYYSKITSLIALLSVFTMVLWRRFQT